MKFSTIFVMLMAIVALFVGESSAAPKVNLNAIKKGGRVIVSIFFIFNSFFYIAHFLK